MATASMVELNADRASLPLPLALRHVDYEICQIVPQPDFGDRDSLVGQRLAELGFFPGCRLRVIGVGFWGGDPLAVSVNGTKFALRRAEAAKILVAPIEAIV